MPAPQRSLVKSRTAAAVISDNVVDKLMQVTLAREGVDPEQFKAVMREAILASPEVVKCDEASLAKAIRKSCQLRVIPDGQHAAIIPFKGEATLVPMVEGLKLAMAQEMGADIRSGAIYEGDKVEASVGSHGTPQGIRVEQTAESLFTRNPNKVVGAWCSIQVGNDDPFLLIMSKADIDRARKSAGTGKVWQQWPDRMAQKTAVKRAIMEYRYKRAESFSDRLSGMIDADQALAKDDVEAMGEIDMGHAEVVDAPVGDEQGDQEGPKEPPPDVREESPPEEKPKTRRRRTAAKKQEAKPKPEPKPEPPPPPAEEDGFLPGDPDDGSFEFDEDDLEEL